MTYDSQIASDWTTAFTDLLTKITGMASWTLVEDNTTAEGYFVVQAPANPHFSTTNDGDDQIYVGSGVLAAGPLHAAGDDLHIETGWNWDTTNQVWGTTGRQETVDTGINPAGTDAVEYFLEYVDGRGWCFYIDRNVGDGNDGSAAIGYEIYEQLYWNIHDTQKWNSNSTKIEYGRLLAYGTANGTSLTQAYHIARGMTVFDDANNGDTLGYGMLNPDGNFNNYVWSKPTYLVTSVTNSETNSSPVVARAYGLWMEDRSGSDINDGDVVQDSAGADVFEIIDRHGVRVAFRMD